MSRTASFYLGILACALVPVAAPAQPASKADAALRVMSVGPEDEIASLAEANEIRVVFSEPMVTLGRIPAQVRPAFFKITPAVAGTFRWSGTTILIFTPNPKRPLPYATKYVVTIDAGAAAVSGRTLEEPVTFSFTTPTVRLLRTQWFRRGGRVPGGIVVLMWFNQPVRPADVARHLTARFQPHDWHLPELDDLRARLKTADPSSLQKLDAKVAATRAIAASTSLVEFSVTNDWDKKAFPPVRELVVLEARTEIPPESWVKLDLGDRLPSPAGAVTPQKTQDYTVEVERAFFIERFRCTGACDPDYGNPLLLRRPVRVLDFAKAVSARDVTAGAGQIVAARREPKLQNQYGHMRDVAYELTLEDAGFDSQPPARTYSIAVDDGLRSTDGQTLGYTWMGTVENWRRPAFTSFGDGHGVWETGGGTLLPFYSRNFTSVTQWAAPVRPADLMPALLQLQYRGFNEVPPGNGVNRRLGLTTDQIQSHGLDLAPALGGKQTGLVWTAITPGPAIPKARSYGGSTPRASLVQVTNLGISVKDSPQNTLVFVTRLDNGAPVAGAAVSIVNTDNKVFWRGTTGADGVAIAPETPLRGTDDWWQFHFLVMAEKDGDVAYVGSNWNEGITPWDFDVRYNLNEASPLLRGTVFTDRGVYRFGEEVHLKAILRENTAAGIRFLPPDTSVYITVRDGEYKLIDQRTVKVGAWSSAEWTMALPQEGSLGNYLVRAVLERDKPVPKKPEERRPGADPGPRDDDRVQYEKQVNGFFLVAAYRRPDFRVDVTLTGDTAIAGTPLKGVVSARYLFGAPMGARPVSWRFSKSPAYGAPASIREYYPDDRWTFVGWGDENWRNDGEIRREETELAKTSDLALKLDTAVNAGIPLIYTLEADVEDVSRQHIANRARLTVHPAPWYVGLRTPSYFTEQKNGLKTDIVTVGLDGRAVAGVTVEVKLTQVQWNSVRRAEGGGFYEWETERTEVPAGQWTVTTTEQPVPLDIPLSSGGYFILEARGLGEAERFALTRTSFYVLGDGYTAWARHDHNRIELVPERKTYKPGDTARIMVQSPWEQATALVTTEREGVRFHRQIQLTSTQQSIAVPITENDIPNLYVSVLLIKGRTVQPASTEMPPPARGPRVEEADLGDPGKPAFRLGYVELKVEDASKRLDVAVRANKQEYRPANAANVTLDVKDHQGRGSASEVTLWAVDYGVLSLTAYRTPDVLRSVYVEKALQVMNVDNRQRIVSRRVLTPKGDTDGGGGGADAGTGTLRKDFRVLAFWLGSVTTDAHGRATVEVKLPESLTTYRIMAVAADRSSRFGSGDSEIRINKPLTLKPTFPRFLAVGDRALFGAVVTNQLKTGGAAVVSMKSLDPGVMEVAGGEQTMHVAPGGSIEARFEAMGRSIGRARVRMTVKLADESDAFEDVIPVEVLASPETVAAYGEAGPARATAKEGLTLPTGVVPGFGGLHVELSSTAMVGLGEGARYLVEYPYGCAEQKGSRALALLFAADLGDAFTLPGMDTSKMRPAVQQTLKELEAFQCGNGGFAYWPNSCFSVSPYLTSYLLHVFKVAADLKYAVNPEMVERAYDYLERELAKEPPTGDGWWPSHTAWQAFAVKVLVEGGRNQDSNLNRLYGYRDRMPVFALAYLHDALNARGEPAGVRAVDLRRRMSNAILPEGGSAHVEELSDPYLLWFWSSNVRSTAIVLNSLVKGNVPEMPVRGLVRWMMSVRKGGRWGNTQENAHAMEALVSYYRRHESAVPDFRAVVMLGQQELARNEFKGRSAESTSQNVPMDQLLGTAAAGTTRPLTFRREGTGTLFYTARLRYAADTLFHEGLDSGFNIERSYAPYVEGGTRPVAATFKAGDLVRVTLRFRLTKERRFVAVTDPLPAGFEPVESWFATTARALAVDQDRQGEADDGWFAWWRRGGFDHVERHDDRVQLFATRLSEGFHEFSYIVRATTVGTFRTAPARAEEMYEPEVFGRTATTVVDVKR